MIPSESRVPWRTDKRSFSFPWNVPLEAGGSAIHVVLRKKAVVIEVLDGALEITDGVDFIRVSAPGTVAISVPEFSITPILIPPSGLKILGHVIGVLPLRSMIKQHTVFKRLLQEASDSPPGIYPLGHHHLVNSFGAGLIGSKDIGEQMVLHNVLVKGFFSFLGSIPRALDRPESKTRDRHNTD